MATILIYYTVLSQRDWRRVLLYRSRHGGNAEHEIALLRRRQDGDREGIDHGDDVVES